MAENQTVNPLNPFEECAEFAFYLPHFLRNPRRAVLNLPHWGLGGALLFQILLSLVAGLICGALTHSLTGLILNILFFPLQTIFLGWLITLTLELGFRWWLSKKIEFRKLFVLVSICQIPVILIRILSAYDVPVDGLGLMAMGYLLYIAVPVHFEASVGDARKVIGLFFGFLIVLWVVSIAIHLKDELRFQHSVRAAQSQLFPVSEFEQIQLIVSGIR